MSIVSISRPLDSQKEDLAGALQDLFCVLERLESSRNAMISTYHHLENMAIGLVGQCRLEVLFMLKNKLGLTKEQAKNIYFRFRNGGGEAEKGPSESGKEPETAEEKIALIMDYMKDTSAKLDQIEDDIAYLKKQVDQILKRL